MLYSLTQRFKQSKALRQGAWLIFGIGASQVIRLLGNLVLTRLLAPEAFGIMAIAITVITAFEMLSDVGIRNGVIKSNRTHETAFMETVWTIQFIRGVILASLVCLLAYPIAKFYDADILFPVLIVFSSSMLFHASKSVALYLYDKQLNLKLQMFVELGAQIVGALFMITWAYYAPSLWALVVGTVLSSAIACTTSYTLFKGHHSRFRFEWDAAREIISFGQWIFISSIVGFVALHGDKLIMGKWITKEQLGVYAIALGFGGLVSLVASKFSSRLLDPLFKQHIDNQNVRAIHAARNKLNIVYITGCLGLAWFGDWLIYILYDDRYAEAGWMLQLLALRSVAFCFNTTLTPFLLSSGDSFSQMKYQIVSTMTIVVGMLFGVHYGVVGILLVYCALPALTHLYMAFLATKHHFYCIHMDALMLIAYIVLSYVGWFILDSEILMELFVFYLDFAGNSDQLMANFFNLIM